MREAPAELAAELRAGRTSSQVEILKRSPVRIVARSGDLLLKLWLRPSRTPRHEARALRRAAERGVPVPELVEVGDDWIATRWRDGRLAERADLDRILPVVQRMHQSGVLHGDLHLGNILICNGQALLLDLQRMRFLPATPQFLRRRELGYLAYSLGEPLPDVLREARFWRDRRAHTHWRSRSRRATKESSVFTAFEFDGSPGFRRREIDANTLRATLEGVEDCPLLKEGPSSRIFRAARGWIVKEHKSRRAARTAWLGAQGLESRGIRTARALAWSGRWLVMEDAGANLSDWVDTEFERAAESARLEMVQALGELLGALHRRGIYHADLKANNVVWSPGATPKLMDYGRVLFRRRVGRRQRVKNLAQLNAALPDRVSGELRLAGFAHYLRSSGFDGDAAALRDDVIALSLRREHRWSGCSSGMIERA